jgi:hypothetical protein
MLTAEQEYVGKARVVRMELPQTQYPRYALRFTAPTETWILQ